MADLSSFASTRHRYYLMPKYNFLNIIPNASRLLNLETPEITNDLLLEFKIIFVMIQQHVAALHMKK